MDIEIFAGQQGGTGMKTTLLMLAMMALAVLLFAPSASASVLYSQDFNALADGDLKGQDSWAAGNHEEVIDVMGTSNNYEGAKVVGIKVLDAQEHYIPRAIAGHTPGTVTIYMMSNGTNPKHEIWLRTTVPYLNVMGVKLDSDGNAKAYFETSTVILGTYADNIWYKVTLSWTNNTFYTACLNADCKTGKNKDSNTGPGTEVLLSALTGSGEGVFWDALTQYDEFLFDQANITSPKNQTYFHPIWVNATVTFDAEVCFARIDSTNHTMSNSSSSYYYLNASKLSDNLHTARVSCNRSSDGVWLKSIIINFTYWTPPNSSKIIAYPASGQTYPLLWATFNASWTSKHTLSKVLLENNFTGTMKNITVTNHAGMNYTYNQTTFSAGTYRYRFWANDSSDYWNSTMWRTYTVQKANSLITMTANPSWTINSSIPVTVTCTATKAVTLYRDGITVSNPYTVTPSFGTFNYTCFINDAQNYTPAYATNFLVVGGSGFGCTSNTTFAFSKTITGLKGKNVTLNVGKATWKNLTKGYYITVNLSGATNITVKFGNYIANVSRAFNNHLSPNVSAMSGYAEEHSYYILTFFDEISGLMALPPASNVSVTLVCSLGQNNIPINDTRVLLPSFDTTLTEIRTTVAYAGDYYSRQLLVAGSVESKSIYLADAYLYTVLQIPIYIDDYSYYGSKITLYKTSAGTPYIITDGYFDADHKFVAYLVKDEKYFIRLDRTGETRDIGFFFPATATALDLVINSISLKPDISLISNNLIMAAENLTNSIRIRYQDLTNKTNSVQILVYLGTNQTAFWSNTYVANNNITVTISPLNMSKRYSIKFIVNHQVYGNSPVEYIIGVGGIGALFDLGLSASVGAWLYPMIAFVILFMVSMVTVPKNRVGGLVFMIVVLAVFIWGAKWFVIAAGTLALLVVFIALTIVYEVKRGGMT
jgi:hypothetical protein